MHVAREIGVLTAQTNAKKGDRTNDYFLLMEAKVTMYPRIHALSGNWEGRGDTAKKTIKVL